MRFSQRKELADKYRKWVKQSIDDNQTMILDCAESVIAFLDNNGYLYEVEPKGKWRVAYTYNGDYKEQILYYECSICNCGITWKADYCPYCGAEMDTRGDEIE